jgi:hypothetical protein
MQFKWLKVPSTNETKEVRAVQLYTVRWSGRTNAYQSGLYPKVEGFEAKEQAEEFAESLRQAFKLLGMTGEGTSVVVSSN